MSNKRDSIVSPFGISLLRVWLLFGLTAVFLGRMTVLAGLCEVIPALVFPLIGASGAPEKRVGRLLLMQSAGFAVCVGLLLLFRDFSWSACLVPLLAGLTVALADKIICERGLFSERRTVVRAVLFWMAFASCFAIR